MNTRLTERGGPAVIYFDPPYQAWAERIRAEIERYELPLPALRPVQNARDIPESDNYRAGKRVWHLTDRKGGWIKECPGTKDFVCCNYFIVDIGEGCPFDCSYCFLQGYMNHSYVRLYGNVDGCFAELDAAFAAARKTGLRYRTGTGQNMDSLAFDYLTRQNETLIEFFKAYPEHTLELKTKSHYVEHLLHHPMPPNVIFSWSITTPRAQARYEKDTSTIAERLQAAHKVMGAGARVSLCLDPIIVPGPAEEKELVRLLDRLNDEFCQAPFQIPVFMGTVRVSQRLKDAIIERWHGDAIDYLWDELLPHDDGKFRYEYARRAYLYRLVNERLSDRFIPCLCMEQKEIWRDVFGDHPRRLADRRAYYTAGHGAPCG